MAKHSVDMVIKARDEASRKFGVIGKSALSMGSMLRRAAAAAAFYFGARAIARFVRSSLELYGVQEKAVRGLADALELLGDNTAANIYDMQQFAREMQKQTVYGDEMILELMAMGSAMGKLSGQTLKDATKAAIGLSKAYKIELEGAMRLVARAAVGDTTTLARYGIKLGDVKTTQEKFNKVLELGARNFSLATGEAETFSGKVTQMRNLIGDLKERVGSALVPIFSPLVERMTNWVSNNTEAMGQWIEKTISYVALAKDIFTSFVDFMREDWRSGLKFVFDSFLILLKTTFRTAVSLAIIGGKGIWQGVKAGLIGGEDQKIEERIKALYEQYVAGLAKQPGGQIIEPLGFGNMRTSKYWELRRIAEQQVLAETIAEVIGSAFEVVTEQWTDAVKEILNQLPPDLKIALDEALADHRKRAAEIQAKGGAPEGTPSYSATVFEAVKNALTGAGRKGLGALESRFLTFGPGRVFDYEAQTARNTQQQVLLLRQQVQLQREYIREFRRSMQRPSYGEGIATTAFT